MNVRFFILALFSTITQFAYGLETDPIGKVIEARNGDQLLAICSGRDPQNNCTGVTIVVNPTSPNRKLVYMTDAKGATEPALDARLDLSNPPYRTKLVPILENENLIVIMVLAPPVIVALPVIAMAEFISYPFRLGINGVRNLHIQHRVNIGEKALDALFDQAHAGEIKYVGNHRFRLMVKALITMR